MKAAYDPRISGVYLHIDSLNCGWGKVEEIRRHILNFKKSGKNTGLVLCCSLDVEERETWKNLMSENLFPYHMMFIETSITLK